MAKKRAAKKGKPKTAKKGRAKRVPLARAKPKKKLSKKEQMKEWVEKKEREDFVRKEQNKDLLEQGDDDIYEDKEREEELEEDKITPEEAGFVQGYEDTEEGICSTCGKEIDPEQSIEKEVNGKIYTFCSQKCADYFSRRKAGLR